MKTYLNVPYKDKDAAKERGARFDMSRKQWYCPDGTDLMLFKRWLNLPRGRYESVTRAKRGKQNR